MTNSESHETVVAEQASAEAGGEEVVNIPKVSGDMGTMFILDLLRQKREKVMRMKKDEKIHEMALKKKQQMEDAKRGKIPQPTSTNYGGFVGVHNLTSAGSPGTTPKWKHNARARESEQTAENLPTTERTDLLIMGMIRDEKEKNFHKAHQVIDEQALVPSAPSSRAKFGES